MKDYITVPFPPSWGTKFSRPWSLVQSLILSQIDSGSNKRFQYLKALTVRQLEKSRAQHVPQIKSSVDGNGSDDSAENGRGRRRKMPTTTITTHNRGLSMTTRKDRKSPHLLLNTSTAGGGFLNVMDEKIYWRLSKRTTEIQGRSPRPPPSRHQVNGPEQRDGLQLEESDEDDELNLFCSVAFAEIEPALDSSIQISFQIDTERPGKFGHGRAIFYPSISPPTEPEDQLKWSVYKKWRPTLIVLPKGENSLQLYDMVNGQLHQDEYLTFDDQTRFRKLSCHGNGNIYAQSMPSTLPSGLLTEFLVFKYPHLRLESRVRIAKPVVDKSASGKKTALIDFSNNFIRMTWQSHRIEFYDLQDLLNSAQVIEVSNYHDRNGYCTTTYTIEKLPKPLFSVKARYLAVNPGLTSPYLVARIKDGYEIRELIRRQDESGAQSVLVEDGRMTDFCSPVEDVHVTFLPDQSRPPRIIVKDWTRIRIYEIVRREDDDVKIKLEDAGQLNGEDDDRNNQLNGNPEKKRCSSFLRLLFEKDYQNEARKNHEETDCLAPKRGGLRQIARKSYCSDESVTLCYDENAFLGQLAIVRFAEGWVRCYVYDSSNYQLQYTVEPSFFEPKSTEVYDDLSLAFSNQVIALVRKGVSDTSVYVFNLCKGLE